MVLKLTSVHFFHLADITVSVMVQAIKTMEKYQNCMNMCTGAWEKGAGLSAPIHLDVSFCGEMFAQPLVLALVAFIMIFSRHRYKIYYQSLFMQGTHKRTACGFLALHNIFSLPQTAIKRHCIIMIRLIIYINR